MTVLAAAYSGRSELRADGAAEFLLVWLGLAIGVGLFANLLLSLLKIDDLLVAHVGRYPSIDGCEAVGRWIRRMLSY